MKLFHTTNPNSTKTMPSNPTVFASSATLSNDAVLTNDYLVVVVLINWRKSLASSHRSLSRKSSSFFPAKSIVPIVFSASRENHDLLIVSLLVSSSAWWRRRLSELQWWTYSGEWKILSMDGEERERENLRLIFDEIISKREFNLFGYLVEDHRD